MITRIEALGFRSLRYVAQDVGPFQLLVGPNGSGKSSFLDVIAFLGDLLRVGAFRALQGDAAAGVPFRAADPRHLSWMRATDGFELAIELQLPDARLTPYARGQRFQRARYEVAVLASGESGEVEIANETLWLAPKRVSGDGIRRTSFPEEIAPPSTIIQPWQRPPGRLMGIVNKLSQTGRGFFMDEDGTGAEFGPLHLGPGKSALANLPEDEIRFPAAIWVKRVLMDGVQRVVLNAEAMRRPSPPGRPRSFSPDGSNLPWVVEAFRANSTERFEQWLDHVRTALPDLRSVSTIERPEDRHRYLVLEYQNGLQAPSWVVSDGTLRLLALTLLAYVPEPGGIYLIEEPENGIHPRAIETVHQSLSSAYDAQILCASHSPIILGMARPADLLCFAKDASGATDIVRGDAHPRLREWKGSLDLGTLFAAGVLG